MELTSQPDADYQARARARYFRTGIWLASAGYLLCGLRLVVTGAPVTLVAVFSTLGALGIVALAVPASAIPRHRHAERILLLAVVVNLAILFGYLVLDPAALPVYPAVSALLTAYLAGAFTARAVIAIGGFASAGYPLLALIDGHSDPGVVGGVTAVLVATLATCIWLARNRQRYDTIGKWSARRVEALLEQALDVILALDRDGIVRYQSPSVSTVLGYSGEQLTNVRLDELVHPTDAPAARNLFTTLRAAGTGQTAHMEMRLRRADGGWCRTEVTGVNRLGDRALNSVVLNIRDVSSHRDLEEQLARQSLRDSLTGLANRALFRDRVIHAVERGRRSAGVVAVLLIDLDDFKLTNDAIGHAAADEFLVAVADRLGAYIRPSDTLARLGGDEFALLVEDRIDEISAVALGERLLAAIRPPLRIGSRDIAMTASIGVAVIKAGVYGAQDAEELLRDADLALYAAKSTGCDRCVLFDPAMHVEVLQEAQQRADLEIALVEEQFIVQYQPIVDLPTLKLIGVEALVRWKHPSRGLIGPAEFIPLAEATGLIVPLGLWVLQQACAQAVRWQHSRPANPLRVSVNLSARQFQYTGLVDDVAKVLTGTGISPNDVVLEITESLLMLDAEATIATLHELKALGVRLAIDDFGTGYSSLSYLRRFPVDIIKIDRSFINGITTEAEDATLTEAVVSLGRSLRLQTVAEGIETQEQSARLTALGCDYGQGFLFARPVRAEDIEPMLV